MWNLDLVQDRGSVYLCASNDDGWLSGGGNSPATFNLPNIDSSHIELAHVSTLATDVAPSSETRPKTSAPFPTGLDLKPLLRRLAAIRFEAIELVPTRGAWTPTNEFQIRFDPYTGTNATAPGPNPNPTTTRLYEKAICALWDVSPLDKTDPFHASIIRDAHFCTATAREAYFAAASEKIDAMAERGPQVLNANIPRYADVGPGGFYLFVTRNRPLVYFPPRASDAATKPTPFLARWRQDGAIIDFANPFGGPVEEDLLPIDLDEDEWQYAELAHFDALKDDFAFLEFPAKGDA